ncbi:TolC family protein [Sulfurimonas sp. CS5]|uniref:TolC family protein n=1 Tax=Sulfurimonas sp. CS5 TaxID=3391145 RepID=UPI0039E9E426
MKIVILSLAIIINLYAANNSTAYQWDAFIQKAVEASFTIKQDEAQLSVEKSKIAQSTLWKNPTLEMSFDDGLENSIDYTYFEVSQQLPAWGENSSKKRAAEFSLDSAKYSKDSTLLKVQYQAASLFQRIYFLKKQVEMLDKQLRKIKDLQEKSKNREELGEISGFESSRIEILRQQVLMKKQSFQNRYIKSTFEAQSLLNVDSEVLILGDIVKADENKVETMTASLEKSPEYAKHEAMLQATKQELALVKATRYALPELYLYSERDLNPNNNIDSTYGFGFKLSLPLWNTQNSKIEMQNAKIQKSTIKTQEVLYKLKNRVSSYHKLYKNSSKQFEDYKKNLLDPSKIYYETSVLSFELGEISLLELLDAQTLYFQSQLEHQNLISQSYIYWLQLCKASSINLLKDN